VKDIGSSKQVNVRKGSLKKIRKAHHSKDYSFYILFDKSAKEYVFHVDPKSGLSEARYKTPALIDKHLTTAGYLEASLGKARLKSCRSCCGVIHASIDTSNGLFIEITNSSGRASRGDLEKILKAAKVKNYELGSAGDAVESGGDGARKLLQKLFALFKNNRGNFPSSRQASDALYPAVMATIDDYGNAIRLIEGYLEECPMGIGDSNISVDDMNTMLPHLVASYEAFQGLGDTEVPASARAELQALYRQLEEQAEAEQEAADAILEAESLAERLVGALESIDTAVADVGLNFLVEKRAELAAEHDAEWLSEHASLTALAKAAVTADTHAGLSVEGRGLIEGLAVAADAGVSISANGLIDARAAVQSGVFSAELAAKLEAVAQASILASAKAEIGLRTGLRVEGSAKALAEARAQGSVSATASLAGLNATAKTSGWALAKAGAAAAGRFTLNGDKVELGGEFFAGAMVEAGASLNLGVGGARDGVKWTAFSTELSVRATAGVGAQGKGSFKIHNGTIVLTFDIGAALGVGFAVGGTISINVQELAAAIAQAIMNHLTSNDPLAYHELVDAQTFAADFRRALSDDFSSQGGHKQIRLLTYAQTQGPQAKLTPELAEEYKTKLRDRVSYAKLQVSLNKVMAKKKFQSSYYAFRNDVVAEVVREVQTFWGPAGVREHHPGNGFAIELIEPPQINIEAMEDNLQIRSLTIPANTYTNLTA